MRRVLFWEALILSALLLYLSRTYTAALYVFLPLYFFLVYHIIHSEEKIIPKLTALSVLTAISLSLRFDYLIWGDPWADYAINKGILETGLFPLRNEEPLARFLTVFSSMLTGINPMTVQKFLIPALGSLAVPTLYVFMKDFMPERGARYSGLLLMVATPYLHWVTQGVRESLGLFMVVLALYLAYNALKEPSNKNMLIVSISTAILPMTHPRAALIFFAAWIGFSFFYLMHDFSKKKALSSALIVIFASSFSFRWWAISNSRGLAAIKQFLSNYNIDLLEGFIITYVCLILLYFLTTFFNRPFEKLLAEKRKLIYHIFLTVGLILLTYVMFFFRKNLALPYPASFFAGYFIMFSLGIAGVYFLLEKNRTPIIGWMLGLSLLLVSNFIFNYGDVVGQYTSPAGDPLRIFAHVALPLAAIAGLGFYFIEEITGFKNIKYIFSFIVLINLVTSVPSIVFTGETFTKDSPLIYDERSWLISHTDKEIAGVEWLREYHLSATVISDRYIRYALMPTGLAWIEDPELSGNGYILTTDRMLQITDFGETFYSKRKGLYMQKIRGLEEKTDKLYSNNYSDIYLR